MPTVIPFARKSYRASRGIAGMFFTAFSVERQRMRILELASTRMDPAVIAQLTGRTESAIQAILGNQQCG